MHAKPRHLLHWVQAPLDEDDEEEEEDLARRRTLACDEDERRPQYTPSSSRM
jgi:hypothetical protein